MTKLNDPGIKQWGDGSQSHQGWVDGGSGQSEARSAYIWPIRAFRDVSINMSEVPLFYFQSQPLRAIFKWPSSGFVSEIFHCLDSYLMHFNRIVTCGFQTISCELWNKVMMWRGMNEINIRAGNDVITLMNRWLVLKRLDWDKISLSIYLVST